MQAHATNRWATPSQWEDHRSTISRLYRRNTLSELMHTMQEEYGFYATSRMYKLRIHAWGLRKNLTFKEAKGLLTQMI
ncbi:hypothetical protein PG997_002525 [Apiospora hydei]|uniref:Clr5 domain-containing protein n=1 Tax=Apiospora hydei TaxID=1337664 RepID=A0ABR1WWL9_9PEZI